MKIFVYGTLRKDMYNYNLYLKGKSKFVDYAYVRGSIYSIREVAYPALIEGEDLVIGEIYEIEDSLMTEINLMEHYYGKSNSENEYNLIETPILDINGKIIINLPVYWYNVDELHSLLDKKIQENDYVAYLNK